MAFLTLLRATRSFNRVKITELIADKNLSGPVYLDSITVLQILLNKCHSLLKHLLLDTHILYFGTLQTQ